MAYKGVLKQRMELGRQTETREPKEFCVILHNDDTTTMEFVIEVLERIFFKERKEAELLTARVHTQGQAPVGCYPYDIAVSKTQKAITLARQNGYPLQITVEPVY